MKAVIVLAAAVAMAQALHYEKPPCGSDEVVGNINGANGTLCAPKCDAQGQCPTDVPAGTWHKNTTKPQCILSDASTGEHYCALTCVLVGCPTGAHCAMIGIVAGVCLYPNGTQADAAPAKNLVHADPAQPHLVQAWSALSTGDGLPGETGIEHYIYTRDSHANTGINGHVWDYGASCKKVEVDVGFKPELGPDFYSGQFYVNCDAVDCCYDNDSPPGQPPDVKQWDIHKPGLLTQVNFKGYNDTTELNDNPVKQAEHWQELDKLPFTKGMGVSYDHFITRSASDIISHRIDYTAPRTAPGSILYGNFTVAHNLTAHQNFFKVPEQCRKNIMSCNPGQVAKWEEKYFKHSFAMRSVPRKSWFSFELGADAVVAACHIAYFCILSLTQVA
jgi:hypothetical protein